MLKHSKFKLSLYLTKLSVAKKSADMDSTCMSCCITQCIVKKKTRREDNNYMSSSHFYM